MKNRIRTMLHVDFRRMFTQPILWSMVGICFVIPVLILVMTTMMDGSVSVDPTTGVETVMEAYDSAWQIIGSIPGGEGAAMEMSMTSMLNMDMLYFAVAVLVSIFVSGDFRSGYAKNLFAVRGKKSDYVLSKTVTGSVGGGLMLLAYFVGTALGGAIAGLPFTMIGFNGMNLALCILSKILLLPIFVSIFVCMSVIGKQKLWLSMILSLITCMFLFNIASIAAPVNATVIHVFVCAVGSILFGIGLGAASNVILKKRDIL